MSFKNPAEWLLNWLRGSSGDKKLSAEAALSYAPIWYGVTKIAGHIAQLPIGVFERVDGGGKRQRNHPIARLVRRPNSYQTSSVFREQVATQSLLEGNGRAAIVRKSGRIAELIPLHPECSATGMIEGVKVHASRPGGDDRLRLFFEDVNGNKGPDARGVISLSDYDVLHIPGLSMNGIEGVALRDIARRNLNAAINTEKRFAAQMEHGFGGSLMLHAPPGMFRDETDAKDFLTHFNKSHGSPEKAGQAGMLREGIEAKILQSTNQEAEMVDNRVFQRQDAALWLGLEQILGDDSSVSYNSLEQKNLAYLMNCLNRWLKRWEEEMEFKLLPARQFNADSHYIRFNTAALLKSDYKTSVESLTLAMQSTIISRNEAREKLDMLPVEGGDVYENPNITPGGEPSEPVEPTEPDPSSPAPSDSATRSRLKGLVSVEARRVEQAAAKAASEDRNFIDWMERFYGQWEGKLADVCEELGLDRDKAAKHCAESKEKLLDVCGKSTNDNLAANVKAELAEWTNRTFQFTGE